MFCGTQNGGFNIDLASQQTPYVTEIGARKVLACDAGVYAPDLQYDWVREGYTWVNRGALGSAYDVVGTTAPVKQTDKPGYTFDGLNDVFAIPAVSVDCRYLAFWFYTPIEYNLATPFGILASPLATASYIGFGNTTAGGIETISLRDGVTTKGTYIADVLTVGIHKLEFIWSTTLAAYRIFLDGVERVVYHVGVGAMPLMAGYKLTVGRYAGTGFYYPGHIYSVTASRYAPTNAQLGWVFEQERNTFHI